MGKTYISVKKLQLIPLGDKEELNRVYTYLKDGMYYQNTAYNIDFNDLCSNQTGIFKRRNR
mgnify:CR=1 FL=1